MLKQSALHTFFPKFSIAKSCELCRGLFDDSDENESTTFSASSPAITKEMIDHAETHYRQILLIDGTKIPMQQYMERCFGMKKSDAVDGGKSNAEGTPKSERYSKF